MRRYTFGGWDESRQKEMAEWIYCVQMGKRSNDWKSENSNDEICKWRGDSKMALRSLVGHAEWQYRDNRTGASQPNLFASSDRPSRIIKYSHSHSIQGGQPLRIRLNFCKTRTQVSELLSSMSFPWLHENARYARWWNSMPSPRWPHRYAAVTHVVITLCK